MERVGSETGVHKQLTQTVASIFLKMNCAATKIFIRILSLEVYSKIKLETEIFFVSRCFRLVQEETLNK